MVTVLHDAWRTSPLVWIHRGEARSVAAELAASGRETRLARYDSPGLREDGSPLLLRLSDPAMWQAVQSLSRRGVPYIGPGAAVMARCYDKYEACRLVSASGIDVPATRLASENAASPPPVILKPRHGSDSIGMQLMHSGAVPEGKRTDAYLIQEYVSGTEVTVAVVRGHVGIPVRIALPEGTPYSFARKYLLPAQRVPVTDATTIEQVRAAAARIAALLGIDWAARVDFIRQRSGRLCFLECDAAPLVGARSVFATSFGAAGLDRPAQLCLLLNEDR